MTIEMLTAVLGWSLVINAAILLGSTLAIVAFRSWIEGIHSKMFGMNEGDLQRGYFQYLGQLKMLITVFNLAPYIALKVIA